MRNGNMTDRHELTRRQTVLVLDLMRAHCKRDGERALYDDGWSDQRVMEEAEALNPLPAKPIKLASVKGWRSDIFGLVRNFRPKDERQTKHDTLEVQLEQLRRDWRDEFNQVQHAVDAIVRFLQASRGYTPPPGRPQSRPPSNGQG